MKRNEPLLLHAFLRLGYLVTIAENGSRQGRTLLLVSRRLSVSFLTAHLLETFVLYLFDSKHVQEALGKATITLSIAFVYTPV